MNNDNELRKTVINWYPGHMAKTKKQIVEDLKLIDVVIEILDARIPISSQNPDIKGYTKNKKKIILLNKSDLSDEKQNIIWVNYFKNNGIPAILVDSNTGKGVQDVIKEIEKISADTKKEYEQKGRTGKIIRIMILGIPNVGKSSFINRITKKTSAVVGNKPGVTRQKQWVQVSNNIQLLDTPGVLWPKFESEKVALNLAYTGTIKDDILDKVEIAYNLVKYLLENYKTNLLERYKLEEEVVDEILSNKNQMENENIFEVMNLIGKKRGAIVSGGMVDEEKVANILLEDFRSGKIGRITIESVE